MSRKFYCGANMVIFGIKTTIIIFQRNLYISIAFCIGDFCFFVPNTSFLIIICSPAHQFDLS
ncbi:MAG: hypothetical protein A2066_01660 [Bacteroidetes bacterium GWB2_41_8]|nr:MAG: hypothetical protein A2066_01660 [Bacteroidetes bacterium GWB2_41_8]